MGMFPSNYVEAYDEGMWLSHDHHVTLVVCIIQACIIIITIISTNRRNNYYFSFVFHIIKILLFVCIIL